MRLESVAGHVRSLLTKGSADTTVTAPLRCHDGTEPVLLLSVLSRRERFKFRSHATHAHPPSLTPRSARVHKASREGGRESQQILDKGSDPPVAARCSLQCSGFCGVHDSEDALVVVYTLTSTPLWKEFRV